MHSELCNLECIITVGGKLKQRLCNCRLLWGGGGVKIIKKSVRLYNVKYLPEKILWISGFQCS